LKKLDCQLFPDRNIRGDSGVRVASLETLSWDRTKAFSSQGWEPPFIILGAGFGGGLMMAVLKEPVGYRGRRKRYAERKARRQAERAKRQQQIERGEPQEAHPGIWWRRAQAKARLWLLWKVDAARVDALLSPL
jgi:hypothetical protein